MTVPGYTADQEAGKIHSAAPDGCRASGAGAGTAFAAAAETGLAGRRL